STTTRLPRPPLFPYTTLFRSQQGYRACLGILRLSKRYSDERLEKACARALAGRSHSYRSVESILKKNLENQPLPQVSQAVGVARSEEHTSELQSRSDLVCRLL